MTNTMEGVRGRTRGPSPFPTRRSQAWRTLGAVFVLVAFVPPLLLLVSGSLRRPGLPPPPTPELIPDPISTEGYRRALELGGLVRATVNSLLVAAVAVPVSVLVASLAGFALAHLARRTTAIVIGLSLLALMVPATVLLVPRFALFRWLGLTDTLAPLVAPALLATSPLYVLVYYLAFRALPSDLYDACRVEDLITTTDLVAGRAATGPAGYRGGRGARLRTYLVQLSRPAHLRVRPEPVHPPAGAALIGHARPDELSGVPGRGGARYAARTGGLRLGPARVPPRTEGMAATMRRHTMLARILAPLAIVAMLATGCSRHQRLRRPGATARLRCAGGTRGLPDAGRRLQASRTGNRRSDHRGERPQRPHRAPVHIDRWWVAAGCVPTELPVLRSVRVQGCDRAAGRSGSRLRRRSTRRTTTRPPWTPSAGAANSCACRRTCPASPSTTTATCSSRYRRARAEVGLDLERPHHDGDSDDARCQRGRGQGHRVGRRARSSQRTVSASSPR